MPKPVFISYSTDDTASAEQIRDGLEAGDGDVGAIPCWMAPRDIAPGLEYGSQIVAAIEECSVLVLLLSESSNRSRFVLNEVERAVSKNKIVIPMRIHNVTPSRSLEFFISNAQWLDAWQTPLATAIGPLAAAISNHIGAQVAVGRAVQAAAQPERAAPTPSAPAAHATPATRDLPPLVGRSAEWQTLQAIWAAAQQGRAHLVVIIGEAGIGKTRLAEELLTLASQHGALTAEAHTYAAAGRLAYAPPIAWLRTPALQHRLAQLTDADLTELARLMPDLLSARPGLAAPNPVTESWQRMRLFEALARAVLADQQPLLLVLNDLQWSDQETLDWLHFLLRHDPSAPLLVLVTVRAEDAGVAALRPWWQSLEREEQATVIELSALDAPETLALAQQLAAGALSAEQAAQLYQQTEGNPLFVVELVRMELQRSRAGPASAPLAVTPHRSTVLPTRMQAVLQTRLAQLSPAARAVVHLAATIGRAFSVAVLIEGSDEDEHTVVAALDELWQRRIIAEQGVNSYDFSHDKLREVAYRELSPIQRRTLHGRVARALEVVEAENLEPLSGQLAAHFEQAGLPREALRYYELAALASQRLSAHREAAAYFERALTVLPQLPKSRRLTEQAVDLRLALRNSLLPLGEFRRTVVHLQEAKKLAAALDDPRRLGWVSAYLAPSLNNMGAYRAALQAGQRGLAISQAVADSALEVMASFFVSLAHIHLGNYREATAYLRRNVEVLEGELARQRFGEPGLPYVFNRAYLAWCLAECGEFAEGIARGEEAVAMAEAEAVDEPFTTTTAYFGVGLLHLRMGELVKAISVFERCIHICETADVPMNFAYTAHFLGSAYTLSGRVADGLAFLERAVGQASSIGIGSLHALRIAHLSEAYLLNGQIAEALASAIQAAELAREHDERGSAAWIFRLLGEIHSHCDPPEVTAAEDSYLQAEALAAELGMRPLVAHCHLGLGRLYRRTARREQAHEHLTTAMTMYREMGMRYWLEQVEIESRQSDAYATHVTQQAGKGVN